MKATLAGALLFSTSPILLPSAALAAPLGEIESSVSLRTGPSTSDSRIRYLKAGESVDVLEQTNAYWYKVKDKHGNIGYTSTSSKYITVTQTSTPETDSSQTGTIQSSVSMREGPSTSYDRIRYAQTGEVVSILGQPNDYWYEVKDAYGNTGYISSNAKYISTTYQPPAPPAPTTPSVPAASNTALIVASVSMREGPSTSFARIRYAQTGESVTILSRPNSYWYEVKDAFGNTGYISTNAKYVSTSYQPPEPSAPTASNTGVIVSSVSLREAATTSSVRLRYVSAGETVTILSKPSEYWYEVEDKLGNVGFVSTNAKYITANYQPPTVPASQVPAAIEEVIATGMSYLGTPYEFGSSRYTNVTFDCSDFVRTAFAEGAGIALPSNSRTQGDYVKSLGRTTTDWTQLKRGDIMFFMSYVGSSPSDYAAYDKATQTITHNAIYLGGGQILHTYSVDAGGVRVDAIGNDHWEYRFLFGGSAL
ncbi:C40 family peptidase [Paenibacillus sp. TRM 82003]|nr:C40 family peptidase [Paenibacillus sp. TRM 82003]